MAFYHLCADVPLRTYTNLTSLYFIYVYSSRRQIEYNIKKSKQTDRQTNKQTLQLIPKHHRNAHNIKERKIT